MRERYMIHPFPVRQERGDTVIHALVEESPEEIIWEELWARSLGSDAIEICCIPLFVRNVFLGDIVTAAPDAGKGWILKEVIRRSGDYGFRLLFPDEPAEEVMRTLHHTLRHLGCVLEWRTARFWGVSCGPESVLAVADVLSDWEQRGILAYETGWT
ncbi:MAG: DUF4265 domain-containing protein [Symbiobacteriaceae bacterium]